MSLWRMPLGLLAACKLLRYTSLCMAVGYSYITWLEAPIKKRQHMPLHLSDYFQESLKVNFEFDHTIIGQLCNYKILVVIHFLLVCILGVSDWDSAFNDSHFHLQANDFSVNALLWLLANQGLPPTVMWIWDSPFLSPAKTPLRLSRSFLQGWIFWRKKLQQLS